MKKELEKTVLLRLLGIIAAKISSASYYKVLNI